MKFLDKDKRPMFLLFLQVVGILNRAHGCSLSGDDEARVAFNAILRVGDIISNWTPIGPFVGGLWLLFDSTGSSTDLGSQITCYVRKYHADRVRTVMSNFNHKFNVYKNDREEMENLRVDIEQPSTIAKIQSRNENTQVAIYPLIAPWSVIHLAVYKQLIYLTHGSNVASLKRKSDDWLLFYAKLMLRYGRPHRHKMIASMNSDSVKSSKILESPANLIESWSKLAYYMSTKTALTKMIDSCRITSGSAVQFKKMHRVYTCGFRFLLIDLSHDCVINEDWGYLVQQDNFFSCRGSGSDCRTRSCKHILVHDANKYEYGWACRGETFWIYSDSNKISHNNVVNIQYSEHTSESYWVSHNIYGDLGGYDTKTCPGQIFSHIRSDCHSENLILHEWDTSTGTNIYDGSLVTFTKNSDRAWEVYKYNSECSKSGRINPPF